MTNDEIQAYREKQYREPATIIRVFRGKEDHGIETVSISLEGACWRQGFGALCFDDEQQSAEFLDSVCRVFGTSDRERLTGMECFALRAFPYNNEPIEALESAATGRVFSVTAWRRKHYPELMQQTALDRRYASIEAEIRTHRQAIDRCLAQTKVLHDDYRSISGEAP